MNGEYFNLNKLQSAKYALVSGLALVCALLPLLPPLLRNFCNVVDDEPAPVLSGHG